MSIQSTFPCQYKGIRYLKSINKWNIIVIYNNKKYDFGLFDTDHESAFAYNIFVEYLNRYYDCTYKLNILTYKLDQETIQWIEAYINLKLIDVSDDRTKILINEFIYSF